MVENCEIISVLTLTSDTVSSKLHSQNFSSCCCDELSDLCSGVEIMLSTRDQSLPQSGILTNSVVSKM